MPRSAHPNPIQDESVHPLHAIWEVYTRGVAPAFRSTATYLAFLLLFCLASVLTLPAQTFTTLHSFNLPAGEGGFPAGGLVQGQDGNFYGTTSAGGTRAMGTIFRVTPDGVLTTIYNFCLQAGCTDGAVPYCTLVLGTDGDLYGVAFNDVDGNYGTVFKFSISTGTLTTLHSFFVQDGEYPYAGLVQADDGFFYGTTTQGGSGSEGVVFKIGPGGAFTVVHNFQGGPIDGSIPKAPLIKGTDGNLYGTTVFGGKASSGDVFKVSTQGVFTSLYFFCTENASCPDGSQLYAGVVQGADGKLYGAGASGGGCLIFTKCGTLFSLTPGRQLSVLHEFDFTDGSFPASSLYQATDGSLYGTTQDGGTANNPLCGGSRCGVLYSVTSSGSYSTIHDFCSIGNCLDGANGYGPVIQGTDGNLYGMTYRGGTSNDGTIFRVSLGLSPFVETLPSSGSVGARVRILGNGLSSTTGIMFNGVPVAFTVVSDTLITTTVPAGATSGYVQVASATGTLTSNIPFRVLQ